MNVSITPVLAINRKKGRFWGSILDHYPKCGISIVVLKSAYLANLPPNRVVPTFPLDFIINVKYFVQRDIELIKQVIFASCSM